MRRLTATWQYNKGAGQVELVTSDGTLVHSIADVVYGLMSPAQFQDFAENILRGYGIAIPETLDGLPTVEGQEGEDHVQ